MKTKLWTGIILLLTLAASAQTNHLASLLAMGLIEEQANRNLDAAIADYQSVLTEFDQDRQVAATAVLRLGECYRMQGRTNEAAAQYERILREFSDQKMLATMSQENLRGMGVILGQRLEGGLNRNQQGLSPEAQALLLEARHENQSGLSPEAQALTIEADREISTLKLQLSGLTQADRDQARVWVQQDFPNPVLTTLMQQLNEAQQQLTALTNEYSMSSVAVVKVTTTLATINRQIDDQVNAVIANLKARIAADEARIAALRGQTEPAQAPQVSAPVADDEDREIRRIQELIQNSPDLINVPGEDGKTPLTDAAEMGRLKVAAYLLDHGADVNKGDHHGRPALVVAASSGNRAMVEFLLSHGADVNAKGVGGRNALHVAVVKRFQSVTEALLAHKADVNAQDGNGDTPLHMASWNDPTKIAEMLLAAGANPNLTNNNGATPLLLASMNNSVETSKRLLAAGADPNVTGNQGETPLRFAARNGSPELVKMLLDAKADPNGGAPLLAAVEKDSFPAAELLLAAGANPDLEGPIVSSLNVNGVFYPDGTLQPPLFLAVSKDELPLVQLLLKFKADPNDLRLNKRWLLFNALSDTNILEALLDAGTKVDPVSPDEWEWTPVGAAAHQNAVGAVAILLQHGANPNVNNRNGARPLHFAAYLPAGPEVFELLLTHGANPNVRSSNGHTPLDDVKQWTGGNSTPDHVALATQLEEVLRRHGALDKLPDWDRIVVSRPADNLSAPVFFKGTNDWNHFTLLEAILNLYYSSQTYPVAVAGTGGETTMFQAKDALPFPDLTRVVVVRPDHDSTNVTRTTVDLINDTNGIDGSKDVTLEFGDVVELPERDHVLREQAVGLTPAQHDTLVGLLGGTVQLVVRGQKVELKLYPEEAGSLLDRVLAQPEAQAALLASSDLSRIKVTRHDPKTGRDQVWIVDCTSSRHTVGDGNQMVYGEANGRQIVVGSPFGHPAGYPTDNPPSTDLWLHNGDVIEVPERP